MILISSPAWRKFRHWNQPAPRAAKSRPERGWILGGGPEKRANKKPYQHLASPSNICGWCVTVKHPYCWWRSTLLLDISYIFMCCFQFNIGLVRCSLVWVESNKWWLRMASLVGLHGELAKPFISLMANLQWIWGRLTLTDTSFFSWLSPHMKMDFLRSGELPCWAFDVCDLQQQQESERFHHKKGTMV